MTPEELAERLRDIRDIDPVSPWPPGPGWWLLALILAILPFVIIRYRPHLFFRRFFKQRLATPDWRKSGAKELRALRARIGTDDPKQVASDLSELLRRVAMARCGREVCAGLSGNAWLQWLRDHDPNSFDWPNKGQLLASAPYAPTLPPDASLNLEELIDAALNWSSQDAAACSGAEELIHV